MQFHFQCDRWSCLGRKFDQGQENVCESVKFLKKGEERLQITVMQNLKKLAATVFSKKPYVKSFRQIRKHVKFKLVRESIMCTFTFLMPPWPWNKVELIKSGVNRLSLIEILSMQ